MSITTIPAFSTLPQVGQSEATFDANADTFVAELPAFINALNQLGLDIPQAVQDAISLLDQTIAFNAMAAGQGTGKTRMFLTAGGQPTYYVGFPKTTWSELRPDGALGTAVHQAFMDGTTEKNMRWIAKYPMSLVNGEVVSQPGTKPLVSKTLDEEIALVSGTTIIGADADTHHQMSVWDWSLVYYWMQVNGYEPIGNTSYGKSHEKTWIKGDGTTTVNAGSMGAASHHDGTNEGVDLLVGNVWERLSRMYLNAGVPEIQPDNGGTPSQAACVAESYTYTNGSTTGASGFASIANQNSVLMKQACLEPFGDGSDLKGGFWINQTGLRAPLRGGYWYNASSAGAAALYLYTEPTIRYSSVGFRAAFST